MLHLTPNLSNPRWYPIKLNYISLIRSSINTYSTKPKLIYYYISPIRCSMPIKLLGIFCTDALSVYVLVNTPSLSWNTSLAFWKFQFLQISLYTFDFGCTVTIKDRNGMDLTEAIDIKKRWQKYTEELYKKDLHDPDNHDGVITHTILWMWSQVGLRKHHYEQS